jgi:hypothetical protein
LERAWRPRCGGQYQRPSFSPSQPPQKDAFDSPQQEVQHLGEIYLSTSLGPSLGGWWLLFWGFGRWFSRPWLEIWAGWLRRVGSIWSVTTTPPTDPGGPLLLPKYLVRKGSAESPSPEEKKKVPSRRWWPPGVVLLHWYRSWPKRLPFFFRVPDDGRLGRPRSTLHPAPPPSAVQAPPIQPATDDAPVQAREGLTHGKKKSFSSPHGHPPGPRGKKSRARVGGTTSSSSSSSTHRGGPLPRACVVSGSSGGLFWGEKERARSPGIGRARSNSSITTVVDEHGSK